MRSRTAPATVSLLKILAFGLMTGSTFIASLSNNRDNWQSVETLGGPGTPSDRRNPL